MSTHRENMMSTDTHCSCGEDVRRLMRDARAVGDRECICPRCGSILVLLSGDFENPRASVRPATADEIASIPSGILEQLKKTKLPKRASEEFLDAPPGASVGAEG